MNDANCSVRESAKRRTMGRWTRAAMLALGLVVFLAVHEAARAQSGAPQSPDQSVTPALRLSLKDAVNLALEPRGNVRVQMSRELIRQAESRSAQVRAALLPDVESSVSQQNQTRNLAAFGIQIRLPIPGFTFPEIAGPFSTFDARATVTQSLFDFSAIRRTQASRAGVSAAEADSENAQDQVAAEVSRRYVLALKADEDVRTVEANITLAESLVKLAADQKAAGTGTGIEITRAQVQLLNERQRLLAAQNARRSAQLELLKAIGVSLDAKLELADKLAYSPANAVDVQQAVKTAIEERADYRAQLEREESARLNHSAVKYERLPSVIGFADYGSIGSSINNAAPTRTYGFSVRVPLFDGGRRDARRGEAASQLLQEQIRTADLKKQIDLDVRLALDSLRSAEEQVKVAEEGLKLAGNELEQAERRYRAGVTTSVEVTDAQTRLERARDNRVAALYSYNVAQISLGQAMGTIRKVIK